ncbi:hypothetical protein BH09MYX1_BH09MYX1_67420 [soil metagenome]
MPTLRSIASAALFLAPWLIACGAGPAPARAPTNDAAPSASSTTPNAVQARTDLDQGEQSIDATTSECGTACKALASMERAEKTLCDVAEPDECDRAKARVDKARAKVRGAGCACSG